MGSELPKNCLPTRLFLLVAAVAVIAWFYVSFPSLRAENSVARIGAGIRASEAYKPEILASAARRVEEDANLTRRAAGRSVLALIQLRQFENALAAGETTNIDQAAAELSEAIDAALSLAPADPFLWLARFWIQNTRLGFRNEHVSLLRASYELGPHEGWIATKRARIALTLASELSADLRRRAVDEFVDLVRWGLVIDAAAVAERLDQPLRQELFNHLNAVRLEQRRAFAQLWYRRDLDGIVVPGVDPPPTLRLPALPPGY